MRLTGKLSRFHFTFFQIDKLWSFPPGHQAGLYPSHCVRGPSSWMMIMSEHPLDCKEIQPVSPKGFNLEYSLEGLTLNLKLQYLGHLMQEADSLEKTLMLGKIEGRRRRDDWGWGGWMASPTECAWVWVDSRSWWRTGRLGVLLFMGLQGVTHSEWLNNTMLIPGSICTVVFRFWSPHCPIQISLFVSEASDSLLSKLKAVDMETNHCDSFFSNWFRV